ncbi:hypothetical protein EYF80_016136 [Liparis tanakae]|uniref:Uncharacterized protein n=1 Tax=Liparis tanakae TaxID=230148 RepID=A0A4Z2I6Z9_9TELE|nr:hypothetical protein EYF80_016136 [Liparis tanakae]
MGIAEELLDAADCLSDPLEGSHEGRLCMRETFLAPYQSVGTSILEILKFRSAIPPTGTRSLPVAKWRSFFCSSRGKASTTSQKHLAHSKG